MCTIFYVPSLLLWNEYPYEKKEPKASRFATHCDSYEPQLPRGQRRQFERRAFETQKCRQPNLFYCYHPSQFLGLTANCFYFIFRVFFFFSDYRCNNVPCKNSNNTEAYEAGISTALPAVCRHHSRNGKCRNGEAEGISVRGIYEYSEGQRQAVSVQTKK